MHDNQPAVRRPRMKRHRMRLGRVGRHANDGEVEVRVRLDRDDAAVEQPFAFLQRTILRFPELLEVLDMRDQVRHDRQQLRYSLAVTSGYGPAKVDRGSGEEDFSAYAASTKAIRAAFRERQMPKSPARAIPPAGRAIERPNPAA